MNKKFLLPAAMALCGAWVWALYSARVADDSRVGIPVVLGLTVATLAAVRQVQVQQIDIGTIPKFFSTITLALMMFTVWGQVLAGFPMLTLPESLPTAVRLLPLFFNGPVVAVITALLFAYPLTILLPRAHWLVPALAAVLVGLLQYEMMLDPAGRMLTRAVMALEFASLVVLVPILVEFFARRMRVKWGAAVEVV